MERLAHLCRRRPADVIPRLYRAFHTQHIQNICVDGRTECRQLFGAEIRQVPAVVNGVANRLADDLMGVAKRDLPPDEVLGEIGRSGMTFTAPPRACAAGSA